MKAQEQKNLRLKNMWPSNVRLKHSKKSDQQGIQEL